MTTRFHSAADTPDAQPSMPLAAPPEQPQSTRQPNVPPTDSPTASTPAPRARRNSRPLSDEPVLLVRVRMESVVLLPAQPASPEVLEALALQYRRIGHGLGAMLRAHGLVVGQAGHAFAVLGRSRPPVRADRGRIANWLAVQTDLAQVGLGGPVPAEDLDAHLRAIHSERAPEATVQALHLTLPFLEPAMVTPPMQTLFARALRGEVPKDDELGLDQRHAGEVLVGYLERLATQFAMALADARHQRDRGARHARR